MADSKRDITPLESTSRQDLSYIQEQIKRQTEAIDRRQQSSLVSVDIMEGETGLVIVGVHDEVENLTGEAPDEGCLASPRVSWRSP